MTVDQMFSECKWFTKHNEIFTIDEIFGITLMDRSDNQICRDILLRVGLYNLDIVGHSRTYSDILWQPYLENLNQI